MMVFTFTTYFPRMKKLIHIDLTEFLAGIIFEIGRLLKNYPELFPEEIKFAINNKEKIKQ